MELVRESQSVLRLTADDVMLALRRHFSKELGISIPSECSARTPLPDELVLEWSSTHVLPAPLLAPPGPPPSAAPAAGAPVGVSQRRESTPGF